MKKIILDLIYRLLPKWLKEYTYDRMCSEYQEKSELKIWYKARRAGWKKKDMGYYYADLLSN